MYRPSDLKQFLQEMGIRPNKRMSQNFLIDGNIIRKMIALAGVESSDTILEIGSGPGAFTKELCDRGVHVIAIEKDPVLAKSLQRLDNTSLDVYCDDILTFPIENKIPPEKKAKVISNLPFHLTAPILTLLAKKHEHIESITVIVQDEVAKRIAASPGNKLYGSITLFMQYYTSIHYASKVSRNCFYPIPQVDAAILHFELLPPRKGIDEELFFTITRTAFNQRRKMLRTALSTLYNPETTINALKEIGCAETARPENLSLEDYINLYQILKHETQKQSKAK